MPFQLIPELPLPTDRDSQDDGMPVVRECEMSK